MAEHSKITEILSGKYLVLAICLSLATATFIIYSQVRDHSFIYLDDMQYVKENAHISSGLNPAAITWALTSVYAYNWHPLTWMSHMLDISLFGMEPGMHHVTNVALHALNSMLLFIVLARMTGAVWRSAAVAALFAVHPLHVESVAWISERKDVLSTFFWLLTMLAYHAYVSRRTAWKYLVMTLFFILGLMAKPMLVTLPFVLLLVDFWPLRRKELLPSEEDASPAVLSRWQGMSGRGVLRLVLEKVPLLALAAISCGITIHAQSAGGSVVSLERVGILLRVQNALISYVAYLWKMIWPVNLAVFYPFQKDMSTAVAVMCLVILTALTVSVLVFARRRPYLMTGWLWYVGTMVPVIGIVAVGSQSMADRYTYVPLVGIFIMIAWGVPELLDGWRFRKIFLTVSTASLLLILTALSWVQTGHWKNNRMLFEHALHATENNVMAHNNLGTSFYEEKNYEESLRQFQESLKIDPGNFDAYLGLGKVRLMEKNYDEAIGFYSEAQRINPQRVETYNDLGVAYTKKGSIHKGISYLEKAVSMDPSYAFARENLQKAKDLQMQFVQSIAELNSQLALQGDNKELHYALGDLYFRNGDHAAAINHLEKAVTMDPAFSRASYALVVVYSDLPDYPKALSLLEKMRIADPDNPEIYYNIACIHAKQNNVEESVTWLRRSVEKGFSNVDLIRKDPDLRNIRNTPYAAELMNTR